MSRLSHEIQSTLNRVNDRLVNSGLSDRDWTKEILMELASLGRNKRHWVYACAHGADGGEWLYDLCWLSYSGDELLDVELAVECEWLKQRDIVEDFQKLCQSRSRFNLMIFQARTLDESTRIKEALLQQLDVFARVPPGDPYLLSCWTWEQKAFDHQYIQYEAMPG